MSLSIADSGIRLAVLCIVMALVATLVYRFTYLGSVRVVPGALARGTLQLAAISLILAAALAHIWSALLVLVGMFVAASFTAARRSNAGTSGVWLTIALASGIGVVLPLMLLSGVVPLQGVALVPIGGIVLGGAMTATSMAAKRGLDAVDDRYGEVEAALSLGFSQRDARWEVARTAASDALLPGVDQTRTVGLVTLPGAFVGVLLATGSAVQAGAVQILVLAGLLLAQTCSVAVALELVARGFVFRGQAVRPGASSLILSLRRTRSGRLFAARVIIALPMLHWSRRWAIPCARVGKEARRFDTTVSIRESSMYSTSTLLPTITMERTGDHPAGMAN